MSEPYPSCVRRRQVFRDLLLSFLLPASVVGVRRTLLLSREANKDATANYTSIVNDAHEAAMRGASHEFESGNQVSRACALLAGLAIVLCRGGDIRKSDAFAGRVALPFLQTVPASGHAIGVVDSYWVCYSLKTESPRIHLRKEGFDGLCGCVLFLSRKCRR